MTPADMPIFTVEELGRKRWSFTVKAPSAKRARELAADHGCTGPATVRRVKEVQP